MGVLERDGDAAGGAAPPERVRRERVQHVAAELEGEFAGEADPEPLRVAGPFGERAVRDADDVESRWANGTCSKKVGKKKMLQKAPAGWWRPLAPGDAGALRVPATFPGTAQLDDAVARGAVVAAYCGDACAHPPGPVA